jgi:hypothetical protein
VENSVLVIVPSFLSEFLENLLELFLLVKLPPPVSPLSPPAPLKIRLLQYVSSVYQMLIYDPLLARTGEYRAPELPMLILLRGSRLSSLRELPLLF